MAQTVFNRYEKKYLMTEPVYRALRTRLDRYMKQDQYGQHTICNIYFDTANSLLIRRSLEHPVYKEKLRLRSYGVPDMDSTVYLEIKKKYRRVVNKRRIPLKLGEAYDYLQNGIRPPAGGQILREIDFFLQRYELLPQLCLCYDRIALFGLKDPEFRVTFDRNIRSRRLAVGLENGDWGQRLLPGDYVLMESKILGAAPVWFADILAELDIYPISFSKYGNIYRKENGLWNLDSIMTHRVENWRGIA